MQFRPGTFTAHATDGDGDGTANPHDIDDAASTAAVYLCAASGGQLTDERTALLAYNLSETYVLKVLHYANRLHLASGSSTIGDGVCPIAGATAFSDTWGAPRPGGRTHQGVDMFARYGTPVVAPVDGNAEHFWNAVGGLSYRLWGDNGDYYYGTHLSAYSVTTGHVLAGTVLGYVGTSGNAAGTPPHLHFEIHPRRRPGDAPNPVNPTPTVEQWCADNTTGHVIGGGD